MYGGGGGNRTHVRRLRPHELLRAQSPVSISPTRLPDDPLPDRLV